MSDYSDFMNVPEKADFLTIVALGTFIYISGFLLSKTSSRIDSRKDVVNFYVKRFLRIYPLYLLALIFFIPIYSLDVIEAVSHVFLINTINGTSTLTLWFVSMIFVFYLIFPIILYRSTITKVIVRASIVFILLNILAVLSYGIMTDSILKIDMRLIIYWPVFILGIITAKSDNYSRILEKWYVILISLVISIILTLVTFYGLMDITTDYGAVNLGIETYLWMSLTLLYIPITVFISRIATKFVGRVLIFYLSYVTFGMFLFHRIIFVILSRFFHPENEMISLLYLYIIGIPAVLVVSYAFQKFNDLYLVPFFNRFKHPD